MPLTPGAKLGPYEVLSLLGEGGMGEVYRARDTQLAREVAIKVLPDAFAADADRLMRFEREAKTLATLNHTNIAQIYGLEPAGSSRALVMELVEGPTLTDRIARGALPLDEALAIAREIAAALAAAHAQGIVHRDLKPANVKLALDGTVKVLDFGLAKATQTADGARHPPSPGFGGTGTGDGLSYSPTITSPAVTQAGVILGTAAYMAPEQARGRSVDKRADIWAFGCVLYEMLTGTRLFAGDNLTDTLAAVVKDQPNLDRAPATVRRLLSRYLEKDPRKRLRDIGDAFDLIDEQRADATLPASRGAAYLPWVVAGLAVAALAAVIVARSITSPPQPSVVKFQMTWPGRESRGGGSDQRFFEISPDGQYFALVSDGFLWVRGLDDLQPTRLEHSEGASYPFWSPDSSSIGFFAQNQLKRVARTGGQVQRICESGGGRGGAWSPKGTIVFSPAGGYAGLFQVSDKGGEPARLTSPRDGATDVHRYPRFLPDGERFVFLLISGDSTSSGVYVGSLAGDTPVRVLDGQDAAQLVPPFEKGGVAHLLFVREITLMSQPFDMASLRTTGPAVAVAEPVGQAENSGQARFSVSGAGVLAYSGASVGNRELTWFDRSGKRLTTVTPPMPIGSFSLDRGERRLTFSRPDNLREDDEIWVQSLPEGQPSKVTFGPKPGWIYPIWSPTGNHLAYMTADLAGLPKYEIRRKAVATSGQEEVIVQSKSNLYVWDWTADGQQLLYADGTGLWLVPVEGAHTPVAARKREGDAWFAQLSPDGRWLAYNSFVTRTEVYVEPMPPTGALWLVSNDGGDMPRWRQDSRELYYRGLDDRIRAVPILPTRAGAPFEHGAATILPIESPSLTNDTPYTYQPSADGQRFLVAIPVEHTTPPTNVVLNWRP